MKRTALIAILCVSFVITANAMQTFEANLSGSQSTPPNSSRGTGRMVLVLNDGGDTMFYRLSVSRLTNLVGAHIHQGAAGVDGPIVFPLDHVALASGPISGSFAVTTAQVTLFQNSGFYVNVHTAAFPNGEIRGQIAPFVPPVNFTGILTGDQQNPPVITNATGVGRFGLVGATLSYQLTVSNIINI